MPIDAAIAVPDLADTDLVLRPPRAGDIDAITDACQDPDIGRFTRVPSPYTREHAVAFVAGAADGWATGSHADLAITDARDGELLGMVGLMRLTEERLVAEIGYWVARPARGRGVATRAVRLVATWGALALGVRRIELMTAVDNLVSQRVAAAAGFVREGLLRSYTTICGDELRDVVMFSLVPTDLFPERGGDLPG